MTVRIVTPPSVEPVTLAEARAWCRLESDDTANDTVLTLLIQAMRERAENITGRAFVQRTLRLSLPAFPGFTIELPYPPLVSVTSVKYYDAAGVQQTVDPADYEVDTDREPGCVQPAYGETWQYTRAMFNAVQIVYEAGYAPTGSPTDYRENMPASLKLWMQTNMAALFENREQIVPDGRMAVLPRDLGEGLLDSLKVGTLFG